MDSVAIENENNHEKKAEEVRLLIPGLLQPPQPQLAVPPVRNDSNSLLKPESSPTPTRSRRSFCANPDLTGSRRPSAAVAAVQQEHRRTSSTGNIFFEYDLSSD